MDWSTLYLQNNKPTFEQISEYINNPLWQELNDTLIMSYDVAPIIEYSSCSAQRGWNVKYRKRGKSLCTLYPEEGYFIALVVTRGGQVQVDLFIDTCCDHINKLYHNAKLFNGSKWLMIHIDSSSILKDTIELIKFRNL